MHEDPGAGSIDPSLLRKSRFMRCYLMHYLEMKQKCRKLDHFDTCLN